MGHFSVSTPLLRMKTFVLLCLAATAVAFDGSGSITSDADLAAMLSGDNAAHAN